MSQKQSENNCYMDGVRVKISEKYKPPPKISLAMSYSQRLSLNRQLLDQMPTYNFQTDECVRDKMQEWRTARHKMAAERHQQLAAIKQTDSQRQEELDEEEVKSQRHKDHDLLIPTQIPLASVKYTPASDDASPINISDFEADTSSPFDNLELKTLNDLEELKMVLQNSEQPRAIAHAQQTAMTPQLPQFYYATPTTSTDTNGYYYAPQPQHSYYDFYPNIPATTNEPEPQPPVNNYNSVPDIIKSLQNQLNLNVAHAQTSHTQMERKNNRLDERLSSPYGELSTHAQSICESIASMGFPLGRVARALQVLGEDEKKIVEYLLSMSQLMDLGFSEVRVASALQESGNDRDKALEALIA